MNSIEHTHLGDRVGQTWFIFRNFAKVVYFWHLFLSSTLAAFLILAISHQPAHLTSVSAHTGTELIWKQTAFIGFWSTCTASAGILGMARFQGVLSSIVSSPRGGLSALLMMISPPSLLGTLAFPLSLLLTGLWYGQIPSLSTSDLLHCAILLITGYIMTFPLATIFLVTRHATTYELVILIPALAISGVLFSPPQLPATWQIILMPAALPIYGFLSDETASTLPVFSLLVFVITLLIWLGVGYLVAQRLLKQSLISGTLEHK